MLAAGWGATPAIRADFSVESRASIVRADYSASYDIIESCDDESPPQIFVDDADWPPEWMQDEQVVANVTDLLARLKAGATPQTLQDLAALGVPEETIEALRHFVESTLFAEAEVVHTFLALLYELTTPPVVTSKSADKAATSIKRILSGRKYRALRRELRPVVEAMCPERW